MSYKNFSKFNEDLKRLSLSSRAVTIEQMMSASRSLQASVATLPADWARQYATVLQLQYSKEGEISDVTPTNAVSTVDSLLSRASSNFEMLANNLASLENAIGKVENSTKLGPTLEGAEPNGSQGNVILPDTWYQLQEAVSFKVYIRRHGKRWFMKLISDSSTPTDYPVSKGILSPQTFNSLEVGGFDVTLLSTVLFSAGPEVDTSFDESTEAWVWPFSMVYYKSASNAYTFTVQIGGCHLRNAVFTTPVQDCSLEYALNGSFLCPAVPGLISDIRRVLGLPSKQDVKAVKQDIDSLLG